jgi:hypothetical protein
MSQFIFRCPAAGFNVQYQLDDDPDIFENEYEGIACPACAGTHLVNQKTASCWVNRTSKAANAAHADLQARPRQLLG